LRFSTVEATLGPCQRIVSHTRCDSSGKMSFVIARSTALGEPGMEKTTMCRWLGGGVTMMPAVARDKRAPDPIDWYESIRKISPNPGSIFVRLPDTAS